MFSSIRKVGLAALALSVFLTAVAVRPSTALATNNHDDDTDVPKISKIRKEIMNSPQGYLHVVGTVTIDNATQEEVYNYISNTENDVHWYPGTLSSTKVSGDGGPGTIYNETVFFFGQEIPITVTVLKTKPNRSFWFTSDGVFTNLTHYTVKKERRGKVAFTLDSTVEATNGVTQEFFEQYLTLTFQNLLTAMGKTGTIVIE